MLKKIKLMVKPFLNWAIFTVSVIASFFIGYYYMSIYNSMHGENSRSKFIRPKTLDEISVSVTDKGEMLIIDRITGNLNVYDESVGLNVFKLYGSRITTQTK